MLRDITVQSYMTSTVISVSPTTPIRIAQQVMEDRHIRHLPVVQENRLVGILSSGDIRRAGPSSTTTLSVWEIASRWDEISVDQVMSRNVIHVRPSTSMSHAAQLMMAYHFNCLPIVDEGNHLVGILTDVDMFRLLVDAANREQVETAAAVEPSSAAAH